LCPIAEYTETICTVQSPTHAWYNDDDDDDDNDDDEGDPLH